MLLLIPISRYRVEYQLAAGRPYSVFEQLTLRAIHEGAVDVAQLRQVFQVHPRLILEALVTLTQAGWLAVGGPNMKGFRLTSAGEDAVLSGREPRSRSIFATRTWIVMERLTGGLINEGMVRYLQTNQIAGLSNKAVRLREQVHDRRINEGAIDVLLPRAKNEWLYRIESIDLKSRQAHWLPITYNPSTREFDDNLPVAWRNRVGPALEEEARKAPEMHDPEARALVGPKLLSPKGEQRLEDEDGQSCEITVEWNDFLFSDGEHFSYLREVLDQAKSKVFIASAFLRVGCLEALKSELLLAIERGVIIDILWGYNSGRVGEADGIEVLKKISFEARNRKLRGRITYNQVASGSHGKIIIWDRGGAFEACVGSFNWLSVSRSLLDTTESSHPQFTNLSMRVRDCLVVARLIRAVVGLWSSGSSRRLDAAPDRWRRVASSLEQAGAESLNVQRAETVRGTARIVIDHDHSALLRSALANIGQNLTVISHKLGVAAQTRLVAATNKERQADSNFTVLYGQREVQEIAYTQIEQVMKEAGGLLFRKPGLHAKAILADEWFCIGSYNFLSTDVYGTSSKTKELSLLVESKEITDWMRAKVSTLGHVT